MRRALFVAAALLPAVVLAITASTGKLLETTNFNAAGDTSYINLAQCQSGTLSLEWSIQTQTVNGTNTSFTGGGTYRVFASDTTPPLDTTKNINLCAEAPSTSPTTINANPVGDSVTADNVLKDVQRNGGDAVKAAGKSCDTNQDGAQIWICAHWTDANSNKDVGSAFGRFTLQFSAPARVTGVSAGPGDSKLLVSWNASTGGATTADHYIASAYLQPHSPLNTPPDAPDASQRVTGTSATIGGLENNKPYDVYVVAYSIGGNPSELSAAATGTPLPGADFWDVYKARGGVEQGGCASGSAGTLALLGVASLVALRRRKS